MANRSKVQQMKNNQFIVTIPRAIAEAMRIKKSDEIEWILSQGDIVVRKI